MERKIFVMLALAVMLFSSCDREDIDNTNFNNLSGKIAGKWMMTQLDGRTLPTNEKMVYTFDSPTTGYFTTSRVDFTEHQKKWSNRIPCDVTISGDKITMSGIINAFTTVEAELTMKAIIEFEMLTVQLRRHLQLLPQRCQWGVGGRREHVERIHRRWHPALHTLDQQRRHREARVVGNCQHKERHHDLVRPARTQGRKHLLHHPTHDESAVTAEP